MKYLRHIKNKQGLTLVEILVTVLILAIILGMIASIVGFFSNFYSDESQYINRQENMRILMLNLEKDIRMSDQQVNLSDTCYIIGLGGGSTSSHTYCLTSGNITRDGTIIAKNIGTFQLTTNTDGTIINVDIKMIPDTRGKEVKALYTIYLRQGQAP